MVVKLLPDCRWMVPGEDVINGDDWFWHYNEGPWMQYCEADPTVQANIGTLLVSPYPHCRRIKAEARPDLQGLRMALALYDKVLAAPPAARAAITTEHPIVRGSEHWHVAMGHDQYGLPCCIPLCELPGSTDEDGRTFDDRLGYRYANGDRRGTYSHHGEMATHAIFRFVAQIEEGE